VRIEEEEAVAPKEELDQPSGDANTTGTLISKINEVIINAKNCQLESNSHVFNPPSY
jgi:hypothetical protein